MTSTSRCKRVGPSRPLCASDRRRHCHYDCRGLEFALARHAPRQCFRVGAPALGLEIFIEMRGSPRVFGREKAGRDGERDSRRLSESAFKLKDQFARGQVAYVGVPQLRRLPLWPLYVESGQTD
jgi:hypothetical protein